MPDLPDANSPQAESSDSEWEGSEFQESDLQDSQLNDRGETGEESVLLEPELLALESELRGLGLVGLERSEPEAIPEAIDLAETGFGEPEPQDQEADRGDRSQPLEQENTQLKAQQAYEQGQRAFETGRYREAIDRLEAASGWTEPSTELGGEIQVWLVTAYEALGLRDQALALCRQACRHRSLTVRQSARRLSLIHISEPTRPY